MKTLSILGIIFLALMVLWIGWSYNSIRNLEEPKYSIITQDSEFEIREYEKYIVAETTVNGPFNSASNSAFVIIAGYIFGDNTKKENINMTAPVLEENTNEEIEMTVPVIQEKSSSENIEMTAPVIQQKESDQYTMAFTMPSKYTLETLPIPNDDRVKIREVPAKKIAVIRFSGPAFEYRFTSAEKKLIEFISNNGYSIKGSPQTARYNPPLSFPLLMRNEIWIEVE